MEQNTIICERLEWIAAIVFFVAFVLTFWQSRVRLLIAAILFSVGIIAKFGIFASGFFLALRMRDVFFSAEAMKTSRFWWALPVLLLCYGIAVCVLLWPSITQRKAMQVGKILHLLFAPPLILVMVYQYNHWYRHPFDLTWLVYALLWFRIREGYPAFLVVKS